MKEEILTRKIPLIGIKLSSPQDDFLVRDLLKDRYRVRNLDECPGEELDLIIVDGFSLERHLDFINRLKSEKESWVPVLLCTANRQISYLTRYLWKSVDELIFVPIERVELLVRVEILLRGRNYSLQLAEKLKSELEEKSRQLALVVQDLRVLLWRGDIVERKIYLAGNLKEAFGWDCLEKEVSLEEWLNYLSEEDRVLFKEKISLSDNRDYDDMILRMKRVGQEEPGYFSLRFSVERDVLGRPRHLIGLLFDINEVYRREKTLQLALKEKDVLLKELFHRTKNNLQIIYSFLTIYKDRVRQPEAKSVLEEIQSYIFSVARVQQHLYLAKSLSTVELGSYMEDLVRELKKLYRFFNLEIELDRPVQPINLDLEIVSRLGLTVCELVNNSCRHGFKERTSGNIHIWLRAGPGFVELEYADDGIFAGNYDQFLNSEGIGKNLIVGLVQQMSGHLDFIPDRGFHVLLSVPVG